MQCYEFLQQKYFADSFGISVTYMLFLLYIKQYASINYLNM